MPRAAGCLPCGPRRRASGRTARAVLMPVLHGIACALAGCGAAGAGPLDGSTTIIALSSSQYASGYGTCLVPPLVEVLRTSGPRSVNGPGADVVVNVVTAADAGRWMGKGASRAWIHRVDVTVGLSPGTCVVPLDGMPAFGIRARLLTPNPDRDDELACLIRLAARTALASYRPKGVFPTDGQSCLRR